MEKPIVVGEKPADFPRWLEDYSTEKLYQDLRETAELIVYVEGDQTITPMEKFELAKDANHLIKLVTNRTEYPDKLYEQSKYRFYMTNEGPKTLRCNQYPKDGWLEIVT